MVTIECDPGGSVEPHPDLLRMTPIEIIKKEVKGMS